MNLNHQASELRTHNGSLPCDAITERSLLEGSVSMVKKLRFNRPTKSKRNNLRGCGGLHVNQSLPTYQYLSVAWSITMGFDDGESTGFLGKYPSKIPINIGSNPIGTISSLEPQSNPSCHIWAGKYPGTFESITTIHSHHKTKYPGTLLFIPRCPTVHSPSVPQIGHQRLLEGSQRLCQKTHLSTNKNKNGLTADVGSEMASHYKS